MPQGLVGFHRDGVIEINRAILNLPLGKETQQQRQAFIDSVIIHEGMHLLRPEDPEAEVVEKTLDLLFVQRDMLDGIIAVLDGANDNLINGEKWLREARKLQAALETVAGDAGRFEKNHPREFMGFLKDFFRRHGPGSSAEDIIEDRSEMRSDGQAILQRIKGMDEEQIGALSIDEMAVLIRGLIESGEFAKLNMKEKFLLYSAAPGTGKGALMEVSFKGEAGRRAPYEDMTKTNKLFHSRKRRWDPIKQKGEKDGREYHFRSEEVLEALAKNYGINLAYVNMQLQGLAEVTFKETNVEVLGATGGLESLRAGDEVLSYDEQTGDARIMRGAEPSIVRVTFAKDQPGVLVIGDRISSVDTASNSLKVDRLIQGTENIFQGEKLSLLEGGYGWFLTLRARHPEILAIFLSPFSERELEWRKNNARWIESAFPAADRYQAYREYSLAVERAQKELDLTAGLDAATREDAQARYGDAGVESFEAREAIRAGVRTFDASRQPEKLAKGDPVLRANSAIIESPAFIEEVNKRLEFFKQPTISSQDDILLSRAMAYEIQRRLIDRDPIEPFLSPDGKMIERYNRVVEGVVQILRRQDYSAVLVNPWGYTKETMAQNLGTLRDQFVGIYFRNVLNGVRRSELRTEDEMFPVTDENDRLTGAFVPRYQAHIEGIRHRAAYLLVFNSKGQMLTGLQSFGRLGSNLWAVSTGGHLTVGDSYEDALVREAGEEIGLSITDRSRLIRLDEKFVPSTTRIYSWTFENVGPALAGRAEAIKEELLRSGILPKPGPDSIMLKISYDERSRTMKLLYFTHREESLERFEVLKDSVLDRFAALYGAPLTRFFFNRDNREHFAYVLTPEEEAAMNAVLARHIGPDQEYERLDFVDFGQQMKDYEAHPEEYIEVFARLAAPEVRRRISDLSGTRSELRAEEYFDVVDERDNLVGTRVARDQAHAEGIRHRATMIMLFNSTGNLLMGTRAFNLSFPGAPILASAGHVGAGEDYETAMLREAREELGLKMDRRRLVRINDGVVSTFTSMYSWTLEGIPEDPADKLAGLRQRLIDRGVLPAKTTPDSLLFEGVYDRATQSLKIRFFTHREKLGEALPTAKDIVEGEIGREFGPSSAEHMLNRDNRAYFAYQLSPEEEKRLPRMLHRVATRPATESVGFEFVDFDRAVQDYVEQPDRYTEIMDPFTDPGLRAAVTAKLELAAIALERKTAAVAGEESNPVRLLNKRLEAALANPANDFDMIVVASNPAFLQQARETVESLKGAVYHPDKPVLVLPIGPEGSINDGLEAIHQALWERFKGQYTIDDIRNMKIAVISMSGFGGRMPSYFGKGLLTLPSGRTFLEQTLRQRFYYYSPDFRGAIVLSIDGVKVPEAPVKLGTAGIQVIGHTVSRTDEGVSGLGLFVVDKPFKIGAQDIHYAFEKLDRVRSDEYVARGYVGKNYVNVSQADYVLSWDAFAWLYEKTQKIRPVLAEKLAALGRPYRDDNLAYNWAEDLFEAGTVPDDLWEDYLARRAERAGWTDPVILETYRDTGREALQLFGMQFVNLGLKSQYLHTNRPDQFYDFVLTLASDEQVRELFDLRKKNGMYTDAQTVHPAAGNLLRGSVVSNSMLDKGVTVESGGIVFSSALENGTVVHTQGAIVNSVGRFVVPAGAIVDSVIAPQGYTFQVKPQTFTRGYLVKTGEGRFEQIIVSIPIRLMVPDREGQLKVGDLKTEISGADGKIRLSTMKVFPREPNLTDRLPSPPEISETKKSLDDLRNLDLTDVWELQKKFHAMLRDPEATLPQVTRFMRDRIDRVGENRSELRYAPTGAPLALRRALAAKDQSKWDMTGRLALGLRKEMAPEYTESAETPHLFVVEWDEAMSRPESFRNLLLRADASRVAVYISRKGITEGSLKVLQAMETEFEGRLKLVPFGSNGIANLSDAALYAGKLFGIETTADTVASIRMPDARIMAGFDPNMASLALDTAMRLAYDPNGLRILAPVVVIGEESVGFGKQYPFNIGQFIRALQASAASMKRVAASA
jgi:isopentenyldiphosphate isomerase/guanylate kinase